MTRVLLRDKFSVQGCDEHERQRLQNRDLIGVRSLSIDGCRMCIVRITLECHISGAERCFSVGRRARILQGLTRSA